MSSVVDGQKSQDIFAEAVRDLLAARVPAGHWVGELSSSALSTATAAFALHLFSGSGHAHERAEACERLANDGLRWLTANQNPDGGWGDTVDSPSNISTTALCWAALRGISDKQADAITQAEVWLLKAAGSLEPEKLSKAICNRYGKDRTFSVPILTMCAIAGALGSDGSQWRYVTQLPFEFAAAPRGLFALLRLPVVSYGLPALISMGYARHRSRPAANPLARVTRAMAAPRVLRILEQIQPSNGGFLEATPLTSFVVMSMIAAGQSSGIVVSRGIDFLIQSARNDGSWPIDTNLATWVTTLSINALAATGRLPCGAGTARRLEIGGQCPPYDQNCLSDSDRTALVNWLCDQQYRQRHSYTDAAPGGWAWTDLPGGVPDADDTAGALLALWNLDDRSQRVVDAAAQGARWLLDLQNRDGGIPTFCRGWGTLPFDRSSPDITAHTLRAWSAWRDHLPQRLAASVDRGAVRAMHYLQSAQKPDGSWIPLWFGNQAAPEDENPTYGTSRVLIGLIERLGTSDAQLSQTVQRGANWLLQAQNSDGGWGGTAGVAASVEETCQALYALALVRQSKEPSSAIDDSISRGMNWLRQRLSNGQSLNSAPIGLYFAKLWYAERLYPLIGLASLNNE